MNEKRGRLGMEGGGRLARGLVASRTLRTSENWRVAG